jgi:hypothetical protein
MSVEEPCQIHFVKRAIKARSIATATTAAVSTTAAAATTTVAAVTTTTVAKVVFVFVVEHKSAARPAASRPAVGLFDPANDHNCDHNQNYQGEKALHCDHFFPGVPSNFFSRLSQQSM